MPLDTSEPHSGASASETPVESLPVQAQPEVAPPKSSSFWPEPIQPMQPYPSAPALGYAHRESWTAGEVGLALLAGVIFMALCARYLGLWGSSRKKTKPPHRPF
ncbi:hypothetical protein IHV25_01115 [Phaeovibrio sulfidiphilus]|uniref:Uncharacterized protein n=1 Tax=Phaeovibrio sulfidiphilus TaxID=1220600 RepID=A0A8J7CVG0_9PROT|nr:hypothetical protein [Phaeovibrio sulfidiphilus]MBE1236256.1 hypothetical protein [Phaeovibrio sulfidiphilus]